MDLIALITFSIGLLLGIIITLILKKRPQNATLTDEANTEALKMNITSLQKDVEHYKERLDNSIEEFQKIRNREKVLQDDKMDLGAALSAAKNQNENLESKLKEQKEEITSMKEAFTKEFKLIANSTLRENSKLLSETHQKELNDILNPLREKIKGFEEKVDNKFRASRDESISLKQEIKSLTDLNKSLNEQAENLTNALKGDNKQQGNWGEVVLERILESSGLIAGEEYDKQFSDFNVDNKRIQPDFIIKLPDDKHIIIDSKVSLIAYERYYVSDSESDREKNMKQHILSVKNHVKILSEKNYQTGIGVNSPDFVLLFIPIESSFSLAMQGDPSLYAYAWDKKVVIVSPTTLLATLRTIASVWKHERQTKNAIEIAERAGRLYDKFVGFVEDIQKIDRGLKQAQSAYDDAHSKLSSGKGNLVSRSEKIKELGAKANKSIPSDLLNDEDE